MTTAADKAVRAQGGGLVTTQQVKSMIVAARRAYDLQAKAGLVDDGLGFDAWRRANLHDVVGSAASGSFRLVTQRDYAAVIGYFGELAGGPVSPTRRVKEDDERRRALWSLDRAESGHAAAFGGSDGARRYADALFEKVHGTTRDAATARQVWAVIFTLRNRAASRRAKTAIGARGTPGVHLPPPTRSERFPAFSRGL